MKVMRFVGRTTREAMSALRAALGPDGLVLANRPCEEGVELLAAAPSELRTWQRMRSLDAATEPLHETAPPVSAPPGSSAEADAVPEAMSTVSFQE